MGSDGSPASHDETGEAGARRDQAATSASGRWSTRDTRAERKRPNASPFSKTSASSTECDSTRSGTTSAPAIVAERRASSCDHLPPYGVGVAPTTANGLRV